MCGIAGILLPRPGPVGEHLVRMLDGCQHRGPDSTGFAVYHEPLAAGMLRCRIFLKAAAAAPEGKARAAQALQIMCEHGAVVASCREDAECLCLELSCPGDVKALSYAVENGAGVEIFSIGARLEIIKGIGGAHDVDRTYGISRFQGTHGIGHVRLATESVVDVSRAHPFWAYGFKDVAIVHNGQITNYFKMKRRLIRKGLQFRTDNDSELIAVYLADKMNDGCSLEQVLEAAVHELDGTFSFLVSTADSIGFAKDELAAKPMVVMEKDGIVAVASEEVSLNRLFPGETLSTFEPFPGTFRTWRR